MNEKSFKDGQLDGEISSDDTELVSGEDSDDNSEKSEVFSQTSTQIANHLVEKENMEIKSNSSQRSSHNRPSNYSISNFDNINLKTRKSFYEVNNVRRSFFSPSIINQDDKIRKQGYMYKKSTKLGFKWQKRWFELRENRLFYFKKSGETTPLGILDFDLINLRIQVVERIENNTFKAKVQRCCQVSDCLFPNFKLFIPSETKFRLYPEGVNKCFELCCSEIEASEWINLIQECQNTKDEISKNELKTCYKFWKIDIISLESFLSIANTADILLFRSKSNSGTLQRYVTMSDYDHVAMILRGDDWKLNILEATSNNGVTITPWCSAIVEIWKYAFTRVTLRKVYWKRTPTKFKNLIEFLRQVNGKKYLLTLKKLFRYSSKGEIHEDYFCSELVAHAWKTLEIIPRETVTTRIWPADFSQKVKHPVKLNNGCRVGSEMMIEYSSQ